MVDIAAPDEAEILGTVDCAAGYRPCLEVDDDFGYAIDEAEVIYWGLCPACRKASVPAGQES